MVKEPIILNTKRFSDNRGFFMESCPAYISKELGVSFLQDNLSFSKKGTVRGLHYQWDVPMGKLVSVVSGSIIDHVVDIREGSENFGELRSFSLNGMDEKILWVPPGFAHGFETLEDSYVLYKCTSIYNKDREGSISIFDPEISITLCGDIDQSIISERDSQAISLSEYKKDYKFSKEK